MKVKDSLVTTIKTAIIDDFRRYQERWLIDHYDNRPDEDFIFDFLWETAENYISECIDK